MKEITRIHIAKVPYEIEIAARKALEGYLKTLSAYSDDTEIIDDVEIRITEILADRGVKKDGIISEDDVAALKEKLGEPSDFMGEGDMAIGQDMVIEAEPSRKLFRDTDNAVLGGVLSGIAAFFGVNPLWTRLIFILVLLASFGTAVLVYIVLWVAVPAAKTAADRLRMVGRPVTVASIRELNESEVAKVVKNSDAAVRRVIFTLLGVMSILAAMGALFMTIAAVASVYFVQERPSALIDESSAGLMTAAFILAVVSGILLSVLFILLAFSAFTRKFSRRVLISVCVVVVLGLASFGTAVGLTQYGYMRHEKAIQLKTHESSLTLPEGSQSVKSLVVATRDINVEYIVADEPLSAKIRVVSDSPTTDIEKIHTSIHDGKLTVSSSEELQSLCTAVLCQGTRSTLTLTGPALDNFIADDGTQTNYYAKTQDALSVTVGSTASLDVIGGFVKSMTATMDEMSTLTADDSAVSTLKISGQSATHVKVGIVEHLELTNPKGCPRTGGVDLEVERISSGMMTINGEAQKAKSVELACADINIKSEE